MNKNEYLNQLSNLLLDLSPSERQEAMLYYENYIDDAGIENEAAVLQELGSPAKLAADIKAGLGINPFAYQNAGSQTYNTGSVPTGMPSPQSTTQNTTPPQKDPAKIALFILVAILLSPIWLSVLSAVLSTLLGILATILGIVIATLVIGLSFIFACILLIGIGIVKLFSLPLSALLLIGIGLIFGGLGILSLILCYLLCTKTLPWLFNGSISLCKKGYGKIQQTVTA